MANQATGEQGFLANLGKVYGIYTGGFLAFIVLVAILNSSACPTACWATCSCTWQRNFR